VLPQKRLAHALEIVVEHQRHQRVILGDVGRIAHVIDRARRAIDEALHAGLLCGNHCRLEAAVVDGDRHFLVELEFCIVGDAGKMQHRVLAGERLRELLGVADIGLYDAQIGSVRQPATEEQIVVDGDLMALVDQPQGQQ
jgi:hypothetical protein